jgi:predicted nucleotidyltransferase
MNVHVDTDAAVNNISQQDIINKIVQILKRYPVKRAALFGSYARGDNNAISDIDIVAELGVNETYTCIDYLYLLWDELEDALGVGIDLITLDGLNFHPTYKTTRNIKKDMRWIYEI